MRRSCWLLGVGVILACGDSVTTTQAPATSTSGGGGAASTSSSGGATSTGGSGGTGGSATGGSGGSEPTCTPETCSPPGHACVGGECVEDCRLPDANACDPPKVCDVGDAHPGKCVPPDDGCVVTGPTTACGNGSCGPGSICDVNLGQCYAELPCSKVACQGGHCWGEECHCQRPPAACTPAPLGMPGDKGTLNDYVFTRCGKLQSCDGGIFDLDFDQECNAFGVTMISGPDYLRRIDPQGNITEITGVTNLNMGEVATIKGSGGTFGTGELKDVVALAYICCANCGCILTGQSGNPQGVAMWDTMQNTLPMMIPSTTFTTGSGPWGTPTLDTGPYGLSWGLDKVLYVGNTEVNGEYHALDLQTKQKTLVHKFAERVLAGAPFDKLWMLVVVDGGDVYKVPILGAMGTPAKLVSLGQDVTSIARDPWSGRVYAELSDKSIVSFAPDGSGMATFQTAPALGRIALAPDGYLYHLTVGWPTKAAIVRWPLPDKL